MRPRGSRNPGRRDTKIPASSLYHSTKVSKWLENVRLVKGGKATNWKRHYKLRHNWLRGSCKVSQTQVAEQPSIPPLLVRMHEGVVVTVDSDSGLSAWSMMGEHKHLMTVALASNESPRGDLHAPTSMAIDFSNSTADLINIAIGFKDGSFSIYQLIVHKRSIVHKYTHGPSSNATLSAIAYAWPYLLTMAELQVLSLYRFNSTADYNLASDRIGTPYLLSSLKSHTAWPPLSLTIRVSSKNILASIAYAMPTYLAGWSVGLQELRLTPDGNVLESRLASALSQGFVPLIPTEFPSSSESNALLSRGTELGQSRIAALSKPATLSYNHPYLLAAHPDNTLTLYMVTSNAHNLIIGPGDRLWGHTSSVSGAYVDDRGKAVSVSAYGNELRIWELEGGVSSNGSKRRVATGSASVQVRPEEGVLGNEACDQAHSQKIGRSTRSGLACGISIEEAATTKGWVAFDEEKVVVLRETAQGAQALVVYDFT